MFHRMRVEMKSSDYRIAIHAQRELRQVAGSHRGGRKPPTVPVLAAIAHVQGDARRVRGL